MSCEGQGDVHCEGWKHGRSTKRVNCNDSNKKENCSAEVESLKVDISRWEVIWSKKPEHYRLKPFFTEVIREMPPIPEECGPQQGKEVKHGTTKSSIHPSPNIANLEPTHDTNEAPAPPSKNINGLKLSNVLTTKTVQGGSRYKHVQDLSCETKEEIENHVKTLGSRKQTGHAVRRVSSVKLSRKQTDGTGLDFDCSTEKLEPHYESAGSSDSGSSLRKLKRRGGRPKGVRSAGKFLQTTSAAVDLTEAAGDFSGEQQFEMYGEEDSLLGVRHARRPAIRRSGKNSVWRKTVVSMLKEHDLHRRNVDEANEEKKPKKSVCCKKHHKKLRPPSNEYEPTDEEKLHWRGKDREKTSHCKMQTTDSGFSKPRSSDKLHVHSEQCGLAQNNCSFSHTSRHVTKTEGSRTCKKVAQNHQPKRGEPFWSDSAPEFFAPCKADPAERDTWKSSSSRSESPFEPTKCPRARTTRTKKSCSATRLENICKAVEL